MIFFKNLSNYREKLISSQVKLEHDFTYLSKRIHIEIEKLIIGEESKTSILSNINGIDYWCSIEHISNSPHQKLLVNFQSFRLKKEIDILISRSVDKMVRSLIGFYQICGDIIISIVQLNFNKNLWEIRFQALTTCLFALRSLFLVNSSISFVEQESHRFLLCFSPGDKFFNIHSLELESIPQNQLPLLKKSLKNKDFFKNLKNFGEKCDEYRKNYNDGSIKVNILYNNSSLTPIWNSRLDNRKFNEVRPVSLIEQPMVFKRGNTSVLSNFSICNGETELQCNYQYSIHKSSRREVGHSALINYALNFLKKEKEFHMKKIQTNSLVLSSDGSSSMAAVCGLSILFNRYFNTPIVLGLSIGLVRNNNGDFKVVVDLTAYEDQHGSADMKITSTIDEKVTMIHLDTNAFISFYEFTKMYKQALKSIKKMYSNLKLKDFKELSLNSNQIILLLAKNSKNLKEIERISKSNIRIDEKNNKAFIFSKNPNIACKMIKSLDKENITEDLLILIKGQDKEKLFTLGGIFLLDKNVNVNLIGQLVSLKVLENGRVKLQKIY